MIGEALQVYTHVLLEFLLELYVFYALSAYKLNRSRFFWIKLVAGLVTMAALAFGASFFYVLFGGTAWGRILVYLVLFGASLLHAWLCFDESFVTVLFCCSIAYAAQNLAYKCYLIFWCTGEQFRWFDGWGEQFELYYRLIYYVFLAAAAAAIWALFLRGLGKRFTERKFNVRMLSVSVAVLAITVLLCSCEDVYFAQLSAVRENRYDNAVWFALRQTGNAFSVICCAVVLLLASRTIEQGELAREVQYLQYAVRQGEWQYRVSKETIDLINVKCHDIKYKINYLMNRQDVPPEEIEDLRESVSIYDSNIETGNPLLNVLFTEKSLYCEQQGITLSCMVDGEKLSFMSDGDLYCLFGNVIDNAIEAVSAVKERERRVVNVVVKAKDGLLVVQTENYFDGPLAFKDGLPQTTKEDKGFHGFGMRSIRMIVHKYGGELSAYASDDVFHLNAIFSLDR